MATTHRAGRRGFAVAGLGVLLALTACNGGGDDGTPADSHAAGEETLAALVAGTDDFSAVSGVLSDAGLAPVFEGVAAYTILVPQDAAFNKLGETGEALRSEEQRPVMVAILRDHIVPGYLTPNDIENAIEVSDDGSVQMTTMGDRTLTFTDAGDAIVVTAEDGATARFAGEALRASNGVAIPVDGLLRATNTQTEN